MSEYCEQKEDCELFWFN